MAESTLSLAIADIAKEVGSFLGFGRTASAWTGWNPLAPYVPISFTNPAGQVVGPDDSQLGWIMSCINSGLRNFYFISDYRWSFLVPEMSLTLNSGQTTYDMPDFFAAFEGDLNFDPSADVFHTIQRVGIGNIRDQLQVENTLQTRPSKVAIQPKQSDGTLGQRFQAVFAPTPDATYLLSYRMVLQPQALTALNPYPLGGGWHAETILESCLAVAEARFQDEMTTHQTLFKQKLADSISADSRDFQPENLGYNSDKRGKQLRRHSYDNDFVTFYGQVPA